MEKPSPILLLDSGTHGDETEIIPFIEDALRAYRTQLPPYIYIREVSPSAVRLGTRKNEEGYDINREFRDSSSSREIQSLVRTLRPLHFALGVSFHMDLENDAFYLYDSEDMLNNPLLMSFQSTLEKLGIPLLNGVDDPSDPILGDAFARGYPAHPPSKMIPNDGTMWTWLLRHHVANRLLIVEIPGRLVGEEKKLIVSTIFNHLILPLVQHTN